MKTIGERISHLISLRGLGSVRRAALAVGIPQQTLDRIIRGEAASPRIGTLQKIAEAFDVSIEWLVTGKGDLPGLLNRSRLEALLPEFFEYDLAVRELMIEDLRLYPAQLSRTYQIALETTVTTRKGGQKSVARESPEFIAALRKQLQGRIQFLREWVEQSGVDAVRDQILAHPDLFRLSPQKGVPK